MHAATDTTLPNPFLSDYPAPSSAPGDLVYSSSGDGNVLDHSFATTVGPPQRPPPPQANTAIPSPAHSTTSNASKVSAFDDLNESIRMALGGSPAKQITGGGVTGNVMSGPSMMQQQHLQHMSSTGFSSPQHQMYSSPAKQQSGVGGLCCS